MTAPFDLAVVLAAGGSRRMGRNKALLDLGGDVAVVMHLRALRPWARRTVVVVGQEADRVTHAVADGADIVVNDRWATTQMVDSLRLALGMDALDRVIVTPVDVPPPDGDTLATLAAVGGAAVPVDGEGREGHPVVLDAAVVAALRAGAGSGGLHRLLRAARRVPGGSGVDWDTEAEWARWVTGRPAG